MAWWKAWVSRNNLGRWVLVLCWVMITQNLLSHVLVKKLKKKLPMLRKVTTGM